MDENWKKAIVVISSGKWDQLLCSSVIKSRHSDVEVCPVGLSSQWESSFVCNLL